MAVMVEEGFKEEKELELSLEGWGSEKGPRDWSWRVWAESRPVWPGWAGPMGLGKGGPGV